MSLRVAGSRWGSGEMAMGMPRPPDERGEVPELWRTSKPERRWPFTRATRRGCWHNHQTPSAVTGSRAGRRGRCSPGLTTRGRGSPVGPAPRPMLQTSVPPVAAGSPVRRLRARWMPTGTGGPAGRGWRDLLFIETMSDPRKSRPRRGIRRVCDLPIFCSMTFDGRRHDGRPRPRRRRLSDYGWSLWSGKRGGNSEGSRRARDARGQARGGHYCPAQRRRAELRTAVHSAARLYRRAPLVALGASMFQLCGSTPAYTQAMSRVRTTAAKERRFHPIHSEPVRCNLAFVRLAAARSPNRL